MKPLIYGYMRVVANDDDHCVRTTEQALRQFAEREGYEFGTIFFEYVSGAHDAFEELTGELQRADAHHVIVPNFWHISGHPLVRTHLLLRLEGEADAEVLTLDDE